MAANGIPSPPPISAILWQLAAASYLPPFLPFLGSSRYLPAAPSFPHFSQFMASHGNSRQPLLLSYFYHFWQLTATHGNYSQPPRFCFLCLIHIHLAPLAIAAKASPYMLATVKGVQAMDCTSESNGRKQEALRRVRVTNQRTYLDLATLYFLTARLA